MPQNKWRLSKTLKRKPSFRPIENDDLRFIWAAYKKGALSSMGERFTSGDALPQDFTEEFEAEVLTNYAAAWTLFPTKDSEKPVGLVLGFYSHPDPLFAPFMIVGDIIWFPWATRRNKIESSVNFFNEIRKEIQMVEYASKEHKPFFEMIAKHGIIRRVGTMHNVYPGEATSVFETRQWH